MAEERQYASTDNKENQTNVRLSDEEKSNLIKFYQKGSEREFNYSVIRNKVGFKPFAFNFPFFSFFLVFDIFFIIIFKKK